MANIPSTVNIVLGQTVLLHRMGRGRGRGRGCQALVEAVGRWLWVGPWL